MSDMSLFKQRAHKRCQENHLIYVDFKCNIKIAWNKSNVPGVAMISLIIVSQVRP